MIRQNTTISSKKDRKDEVGRNVEIVVSFIGDEEDNKRMLQ